MKRKWWLVFSLIYLVLVVIVAVFVWPRGETLALTLPGGDAILLAGVIIIGLAIVGIVLSNLREDRQRLFAETRNLEGVIQEQQEFRRALNHELNNPIMAISAGLERLNDERDADVVMRLKMDVERVSSLLITVNALARLETVPIERSPVKLDEIVRQAEEMIRATPATGGRKFAIELPPGPFPLPLVFGDDDLLFIVVHNLLNNAVKFTPENGEVVIRAFEDNDTVVIQVSDNGMGIRKEDLDNVWKPFFRGQEAKDRKIPGSGLGLYQVYKIVARHGGQVSIRSKVGEGTVVTIRLPASSITKP